MVTILCVFSALCVLLYFNGWHLERKSYAGLGIFTKVHIDYLRKRRLYRIVSNISLVLMFIAFILYTSNPYAQMTLFGNKVSILKACSIFVSICCVMQLEPIREEDVINSFILQASQVSCENNAVYVVINKTIYRTLCEMTNSTLDEYGKLPEKNSKLMKIYDFREIEKKLKDQGFPNPSPKQIIAPIINTGLSKEIIDEVNDSITMLKQKKIRVLFQ